MLSSDLVFSVCYLNIPETHSKMPLSAPQKYSLITLSIPSKTPPIILATHIITMIAIIAKTKEKNSYMRSLVLFSLFFLSLFISTYSTEDLEDALDLCLWYLLALVCWVDWFECIVFAVATTTQTLDRALSR